MAFEKIVWSLIVTLAILYLGGALFFWENEVSQPFEPDTHIDMWLFAFGWSMGNLGYWLMAGLIALFVGIVYWLIGRLSGAQRRR